MSDEGWGWDGGRKAKGGAWLPAGRPSLRGDGNGKGESSVCTYDYTRTLARRTYASTHHRALAAWGRWQCLLLMLCRYHIV